VWEVERSFAILFLDRAGGVRKAVRIPAGSPGLPESGYLGDLPIAGVGDVDGDGVPDLAVGSGFDDDGGELRGAVFVAFLGADGTRTRSRSERLRRERERRRVARMGQPERQQIHDDERVDDGRAVELGIRRRR
jgi:hypothetical protein